MKNSLGNNSGTYYGFTPDGQQYRVDQVGTSKLIRTKPTVNSYLKRILREVVREEKQKEEREFKLLKSICWFEVGGGKDYLRGSFDLEHYRKVNEARLKYVHKCDCCKERFRPNHGVDIMGLKVCNVCIEETAHFDYLRNEHCLSDRKIWDACQTMKTI